jgi:tetratricopeptide (TPR) repeat protein
MRSCFARFLVACSLAVLAAGVARADDLSAPLPAAPKAAAEDEAPTPAPAPKTPAEIRADLYARLAASKDSDETEGLIHLLLGSYTQSGSDTGDLLLSRARKAIDRKDYASAGKILDDTVAVLPDWAEAWNARATLRYLDDDTKGSMADSAETLKREPRHLGALSGMAMILDGNAMYEDAVKVYERALAVAPHWKTAEDAIERLRKTIAGQEL